MNPKRRILLALGASAGWLAAAPALAQSNAYPTRPVTLVLPSGPGSGVDVLGRLVGQKLSEVLGQPVIIENLPGASGVIGVMRAVRARPDGHTLLFTFNQPITMNPFTVANLPYDPLKDLVPVTRISQSSFVWVVNSQVPVKTFPELIAYAKAHPGKLAIGMPGFGSAAYLGIQLLAHQAGVDFLPVNYRTSMGPDLISNTVQLGMMPPPQVPPLLGSGKTRALASTGSRRLAAMGDLPTVSEFIPGHVIEGWYALFAPRETPPQIVSALASAWRRVAATPDVKASLATHSNELVGGTPEELTEVVHRELQMWGDLVKARNIKPAQ